MIPKEQTGSIDGSVGQSASLRETTMINDYGSSYTTASGEQRILTGHANRDIYGPFCFYPSEANYTTNGVSIFGGFPNDS